MPSHPDFGKLLPCQDRWHSGERMREAQRLSGLKPHEMEYTLDSIIELNGVTREMLGIVRDFLAEPKGWLYLWGGPGNGKTLALQAAVNHYTAQGRTALYITFADLLDLMRETFKKKPDDHTAGTDAFEDAWNAWKSYQARFSRVRRVELLAIDEFDGGKVNQTEFAGEFRARLIDHRYRDAVGGNTVTLFAGNENPAALPRWIWDRVRDGRFQVWENTGASVRPQMMW